jgi:hypothetical protein
MPALLQILGGMQAIMCDHGSVTPAGNGHKDAIAQPG